ncbi:sensor histidine kinase [Metabacillus idriensis]|uniref:sensor histidine kinase n=1 Tax=Metabacillus idriensis TaxID=324768 RepID=UPI00174DB0B3|nr:ATP-binding protein [Metabacillus idriensis]
MNKLAIKIGLLFFTIILVVETCLFLFLYRNLVNTRVDEEITALQARGNSHRDVLLKHNDEMTREHVVLMESEADTDVVLTNEAGNILHSSKEIHPYMQQIINQRTKEREEPSQDWQDHPFISSVSPISENGETTGYVFMFKGTDSLQSMIARLNDHFIFLGTVSVILTIIAVVFLSKIVTKPLLSMKQATERLSEGDFTVKLHMQRNDELGELGDSIQKLGNDLSHLKQERNEFLAGIAHELRTPLTYIKGYADVAQRSEISKDDQMKYLSIIGEQTEHLSLLVEDLFELAKLDHHSFHVEKERIELGSFLKKTTEKINPILIKENRKVNFQLPSCLVHHMIDAARFEQVLHNIMDNAIHYSEKGSSITIKLTDEDEKIEIIVSDEGIGIPKEDLPFVFDKLYRVDKSRSRHSGGTGLGLAIVKEIIESLGGNVQAKSHLGIGTSIIIVFRKD